MPVPEDLDATWSHVQDELRSAVTDATYHLWLAPLRLEARLGAELYIAAPDEIRTWVSDRYQRALQTSAAAVLGPETTISIVAPGAAPRASTAPGPAAREDCSLNPKYTFSQFVIGDNNRLAHAAALAVAEQPGQAYNPLFIYGPPGLGKTHLLHSIANFLGTYGGGLTVRYVTGEAFTDEFVRALQRNDIGSFKRRYRSNDVLLVDDVQFLERKTRTETEFFHTFNALYDAGSQLVLASDRLPRDLAALEERLRERFEAGLVTSVSPPDLATRLTVLRMRARRDGFPDIDEGALHAIAARIDTNIRALEGALIRVVAFHSLTARPLSAELATEVLDDLYPSRRPRVRTVREIQEAACRAFGVTLEELLSPRRTARIAKARQVAMYLARELTDDTLPAIGREFGNRNHTTVLHAHRSTAERIACDPELYEAVATLTEALRCDDDRTS